MLLSVSHSAEGLFVRQGISVKTKQAHFESTIELTWIRDIYGNIQ